ncbi:hypothetical protein HRbin38_00177 [bacterium HR38]|nr:hypothetical protein HRbin38_00177 [bacterium HR38]
MGLGHLGGHGKAKALPRLPGGPEEGPGRLLQGFFRHSRPLVLHLQEGFLPLHPQGHLHPQALPVQEGILQKVPQGLGKKQGIPLESQMAGTPVGHAEGLGLLAGQLGQVQGNPLHPSLPGQDQEGLHQALHAEKFLLDCLLGLLPGQIPCLRRLQLGQGSGHRGPQLVGGVPGEAALPIQKGLEALQHVVEGLRQGLELPSPSGGHPVGKIPGVRHPPGHLREAGKGGQSHLGHPGRQEHRQEGEQGPASPKGQAEAGQGRCRPRVVAGHGEGAPRHLQDQNPPPLPPAGPGGKVRPVREVGALVGLVPLHQAEGKLPPRGPPALREGLHVEEEGAVQVGLEEALEGQVAQGPLEEEGKPYGKGQEEGQAGPKAHAQAGTPRGRCV